MKPPNSHSNHTVRGKDCSIRAREQIMAQGNWEANTILDLYIHDYLLKRNLQATAKAFLDEAKVEEHSVAIDTPGGFLFEWWSIFWDLFITRTNEKPSDVAAAYVESQQMKTKELKFQQYQQQRVEAQLHRDGNYPALNGSISRMNSDGLLEALAASPLAGHLKNMNSMDSEAFLKSATSFPGQLLQGNVPLSPQIQGRNPQTTDLRLGSGVAQRSLPVDPSSLCGQGLIHGKSGLGGSGLNQGAGDFTLLNGLPVTGNDQLHSSLGQQFQSPFIPALHQYSDLSVQPQQLLAQSHAQGFEEMDPRRLRTLSKGRSIWKDGQTLGNHGPIDSPMQPSSLVRQDQAMYAMKFKTGRMQSSTPQQSQEQMQQRHQLEQNNRKRKPTSFGAANSTGAGNAVGPLNSQPLTPPNTAGDGVAKAVNVPHASGVPKSSIMYGMDGVAGFGPSSDQMNTLEPFRDANSFDDPVDSFLANEGDERYTFPPLNSGSVDHNSATSKDLPFREFGSNRLSNNKVLCCHFSSDAKFLAGAGHQKKVFIWNMGNLQTESTPEEHSHVITDIRFRPDSTQLATSSFDGTVRLLDAAEPSFYLHTFAGHNARVTSLDFHPTKTDLLCSCDDTGEIRLWNISQHSGSLFCKGGSYVRVQPKIGHLLAAAAENVISIFDFETKRKTHSFQGHSNTVQSCCWDQNGKYLASVSHDAAIMWCLSSGKPIKELKSNGNNFYSCVFHPTYSGALFLGGYQTLQMWSVPEDRVMTENAHEGVISSLAQSPPGSIASSSHDGTVKLWEVDQVMQKANT